MEDTKKTKKHKELSDVKFSEIVGTSATELAYKIDELRKWLADSNSRSESYKREWLKWQNYALRCETIILDAGLDLPAKN